MHPGGPGKSPLHLRNRFREDSNLGNSFQNRQLLEWTLVEVEEKVWPAPPLEERRMVV